MTENQPKFTSEEINARIECLKIASAHVRHHSETWYLARDIYYWLTTDNDPYIFYADVADPDGILWKGAIPSSNRPK